jgi:hypothetical protein
MHKVWQALSRQCTIELPLPGCPSPGDATLDDRAQERLKNTADAQTAEREHVIALQTAARVHAMELGVAENKLKLAEDSALDAELEAAALQEHEHKAAAKAKDDEHVEAKDDEHVEALGGAEGLPMEAVFDFDIIGTDPGFGMDVDSFHILPQVGTAAAAPVAPAAAAAAPPPAAAAPAPAPAESQATPEVQQVAGQVVADLDYGSMQAWVKELMAEEAPMVPKYKYGRLQGHEAGKK